MREFIFNNEKERLDKFLLRLLPRANAGFIYKMLRKKNILLNEKKATGKEILAPGDKVSIYFSEETFLKFEDKDALFKIYEDISALPYKNLSVCYEDREKIIVNKPFGILSQKSGPDDVSVNEMILSYLINNGLSFEEFKEYKPSVLNRLDRNTGGLILAAKTRASAIDLSSKIKEKIIRRKYYCIVHGCVDWNGEYRACYRKNTEKNIAEILSENAQTGDKIGTVFSVIKTDGNKDISLVSCELLTGKSHQIRAMTKYLLHPIINDEKYGDKKRDEKLFGNMKKRLFGQYLFAREMIFPEGLSVKGEIPKEFKEFFDI